MVVLNWAVVHCPKKLRRNEKQVFWEHRPQEISSPERYKQWDWRKIQMEEKEEKSKEKKRRPYQKPILTVEELFEATVLGCNKMGHCPNPKKKS